MKNNYNNKKEFNYNIQQRNFMLYVILIITLVIVWDAHTKKQLRTIVDWFLLFVQ